MLDEQDATNVDQKGLPFTVRLLAGRYHRSDKRETMLDSHRLRDRPQEDHPFDDCIPSLDRP